MLRHEPDWKVGSKPCALILPYLIPPAQDKLRECIYCDGKVYGHGTRQRQVRIAGEKKWCRVRRFRCTECGKTFTRLPDFLLPYKRYVAQEIEGVLRHLYNGSKLSEAPSAAEESTLRRWRNEFSRKMQEWAGLLESRVFKLSHRAPSFIKLLSHPLRRLEKALSRLPALPSQWTVLIKTLWWLNHPTHFDLGDRKDRVYTGVKSWKKELTPYEKAGIRPGEGRSPAPLPDYRPAAG